MAHFSLDAAGKVARFWVKGFYNGQNIMYNEQCIMYNWLRVDSSLFSLNSSFINGLSMQFLSISLAGKKN